MAAQLSVKETTPIADCTASQPLQGESSTVEDEKNTIRGYPKILALIVGKVDEGRQEENYISSPTRTSMEHDLFSRRPHKLDGLRFNAATAKRDVESKNSFRRIVAMAQKPARRPGRATGSTPIDIFDFYSKLAGI